jgi:hypothetical protein
MGGFLYRLGICLKDRGEQRGCGWLIRLGLRIRDFVLRRGVVEDGKIKIK